MNRQKQIERKLKERAMITECKILNEPIPNGVGSWETRLDKNGKELAELMNFQSIIVRYSGELC